VGQKVNPISFRLIKHQNWDSRWFAKKDYTKLLLEDLKIRNFIMKTLAKSYIDKVSIKRGKNTVEVNISTARPGMIIGRSGASINALKDQLAKLTKETLKINIQEVKEPNLNAFLVAYNIAQQIEKRISYKRAMKQAMTRTMESGAKGIKVTCKGRLGGVEIARRESFSTGSLPLGTMHADIDYGQIDAHTTYGIIGIKVWINKVKENNVNA